MPSTWQSEQEFRRSQAGGPVTGLPRKHIHVDDGTQPTAAQQTSGQLYGNASEALTAAPVICCPNCGQPASAIASGGQAYTRPIKETGGKTHIGSVPVCPLPGFDIPLLYYAVEPCGCRVAHEWAGAFSQELSSRLSGALPQPVRAMTEVQRQQKICRLEAALTQLYRFQSQAGDTDTKKDIDYWIVIVVDQLFRICPGEHNRRVCPKTIDSEVRRWADTNGHQRPGNASMRPVGFGGVPLEEDNLGIPQEFLDGGEDYQTAAPRPRGLGSALQDTPTHDPPEVPPRTFLGRGLRTMPIEEEPRVEVYGGTPEQAAVYEAKNRAPAPAPGTLPPRELLVTVLENFEPNRPLIYSLIQQWVCNSPVSAEQLVTYAVRIRGNIETYLTHGATLKADTLRFLFGYQALSELPASPLRGPAPLPPGITAPPDPLRPRVARHIKKKRTIRKIVED